MRTRTHLSLLAAAFTLLVPVSSFAQKADLKTEVMKDWADQKSTMAKISNEMPEDKFSYKSTPPQRNYGEQILHVAQANVGLGGMIGGNAPKPNINMKATSKTEIVTGAAFT